MRLKDKVVLITGSAQGIGLACAKYLCKKEQNYIIRYKS